MRHAQVSRISCRGFENKVKRPAGVVHELGCEGHPSWGAGNLHEDVNVGLCMHLAGATAYSSAPNCTSYHGLCGGHGRNVLASHPHKIASEYLSSWEIGHSFSLRLNTERTSGTEVGNPCRGPSMTGGTRLFKQAVTLTSSRGLSGLCVRHNLTSDQCPNGLARELARTDRASRFYGPEPLGAWDDFGSFLDSSSHSSPRARGVGTSGTRDGNSTVHGVHVLTQ